MATKGGFRALDAAVHQSEMRYFVRTGETAQAEQAFLEMPFLDLLRWESADQQTIQKIQALKTRWVELEMGAAELEGSKEASAAEKKAARKVADEFYGEHETDFALLASLSGESEVGDYEFAQRKIGALVFMNFIKARGATPMDMFRQLTAIGRALHIPPFHAMTMHEIAMMEGQSAAAHSWRCKILSGEIELAGMKGSRMPGQKSKAATESYKQCRKGNNNRLGGRKATAAKEAASKAPRKRQGSFLKKLQVRTTPKKT